jgi:hypothetical protein
MALWGIRKIYSVAIVLAASALSFGIDLLERGFNLLLGIVDARPQLMLAEGWGGTHIAPSGHQISNALFHRNRHEAGRSRLAATRHI